MWYKIWKSNKMEKMFKLKKWVKTAKNVFKLLKSTKMKFTRLNFQDVKCSKDLKFITVYL